MQPNQLPGSQPANQPDPGTMPPAPQPQQAPVSAGTPQPVAQPQMPVNATMPAGQPVAPMPPIQTYGPQAGSMNPAADMQLPRKSGLKSKLKIILPVVGVLAILAGGAFFAKGFLFDPSEIKSSDLVEDTALQVTFKRPEKWRESDHEITGFTNLYTLEGKDINEGGILGISVTSEYLDTGSNFEDLPEDIKQQVKDLYETSLSSAVEDAGTGGLSATCKPTGTVAVSDASNSNFSMALQGIVPCEGEEDGKTVSGKLGLVFGIKKQTLYTLVVVAHDASWSKNQAAIDEIISSFKPVN